MVISYSRLLSGYLEPPVFDRRLILKGGPKDE